MVKRNVNETKIPENGKRSCVDEYDKFTRGFLLFAFRLIGTWIVMFFGRLNIEIYTKVNINILERNRLAINPCKLYL